MTENTNNMAVLRSKTLSTLAGINAVEGFDPHMVTACYEDTEGNGRMYLQAEFSMLWFRLKYPNGRLEQVLSRMNDQMATVEGRVYDNEGNLLANAFVTRYRGEGQFGMDYVQNAGTAAIRKALGNCGFGTPADAVYIEGVTPLFKAAEDEDAPVDAGVQTRIPIPPVPKEYQQNAEPAPAAPKRGRKPAAKPAPAPAPVPTPAPEPVKEEVKAVPAPAPVDPSAAVFRQRILHRHSMECSKRNHEIFSLLHGLGNTHRSGFRSRRNRNLVRSRSCCRSRCCDRRC